MLNFPFVPADDSSAMKDVIVSVDMSKDSDGDSSKPSSKATSVQNSPAVQKGPCFTSLCVREEDGSPQGYLCLRYSVVVEIAEKAEEFICLESCGDLWTSVCFGVSCEGPVWGRLSVINHSGVCRSLRST